MMNNTVIPKVPVILMNANSVTGLLGPVGAHALSIVEVDYNLELDIVNRDLTVLVNLYSLGRVMNSTVIEINGDVGPNGQPVMCRVDGVIGLEQGCV